MQFAGPVGRDNGHVDPVAARSAERSDGAGVTRALATERHLAAPAAEREACPDARPPTAHRLRCLSRPRRQRRSCDPPCTEGHRSCHRVASAPPDASCRVVVAVTVVVVGFCGGFWGGLSGGLFGRVVVGPRVGPRVGSGAACVVVELDGGGRQRRHRSTRTVAGGSLVRRRRTGDRQGDAVAAGRAWLSVVALRAPSTRTAPTRRPRSPAGCGDTSARHRCWRSVPAAGAQGSAPSGANAADGRGRCRRGPGRGRR